MSNKNPVVSICIPVLNGADRLGTCLASIHALNCPTDSVEIIVADGGSTDGSPEVARAWGARVLNNPGKTVAAGRNVSFAAARGQFIASTDDDCEVPPDWLDRALEAFDAPEIGAVGGLSVLPDTSGAWPEAANWVFRVASRAGYSVQADRMEIGDVGDLPGCNVIYRTQAVRDTGLFDENLITAEDVDFHRRIRAKGMRLKSAPGVTVTHHKRPTVSRLFHQLRRYSQGRVQLGRKWTAAVRPGHIALGWSLPVLLSVTPVWLAVAPLSLLVAVSLCGAAIAAFAHVEGLRPRAALLAPIACVVVAAGWSIGYLETQLARGSRATEL